MAGLNLFIDIPFPELGEEDGKAIVWVRIRNPKILPTDHVMADAAQKPKLDAEGNLVDPDTARNVMYAKLASLIVAGYIPDLTAVTDPDADVPCIPMPPRAEDIGRMPMQVTSALTEELRKAVPQ